MGRRCHRGQACWPVSFSRTDHELIHRCVVPLRICSFTKSSGGDSGIVQWPRTTCLCSKTWQLSRGRVRRGFLPPLATADGQLPFCVFLLCPPCSPLEPVLWSSSIGRTRGGILIYAGSRPCSVCVCSAWFVPTEDLDLAAPRHAGLSALPGSDPPGSPGSPVQRGCGGEGGAYTSRPASAMRGLVHLACVPVSATVCLCVQPWCPQLS